jgi:hypothetical protein
MKTQLPPALALLVTAIFTALLSSSTTTTDASPLTAGHYTKGDDASWAVVSNTLSDPNAQAVYDEFIEGCRRAAGSPDRAKNMCDEQELYRMRMNLHQPQSVLNYTETGFLKIKAPDAVFQLIKDFWDANRDEQSIEWETINPYHNMWDSPPTILRVDNRTLKGGGTQLQAAISNAARDAMEVRCFFLIVSMVLYFFGFRVALCAAVNLHANESGEEQGAGLECI